MIARHFLARLSLASLGGLLMLVCGLLAYDRIAETPNRPTIDLTSNDLLPMSPNGKTTAEGVEVLSLGPGDQAMLLAAMRGTPADRYPGVRWDIRGLSPDQNFTLVWTSSAEPDQNQSLAPTAAERKAARLDLSQESAWAGRILAFGISISGPSSQPILVERLSLLPEPPTWRETLEGQLRNWLGFGPWRNNSINLHRVVETNLLTPVATVAIWIALTFIIYFIISRRLAAPATAKAFAVLVLIGWLVLDVHWQWELVGRLGSTFARYGVLEPSERPRAAPDKEVIDAARSIREHLGPAPARIFLVSADPQSYRTARLGYHLLPHRVYRGLTKIPSPIQAHPGDYIFLALPTRDIGYDRDRKILRDRNTALPADAIVILPGIGGLFRVQGEATS